jgi:hypothetical protein
VVVEEVHTMSAAYYDIQAEQGATFRIYLTVADDEGKALNLKGDSSGFIPVAELPEGFEDRFAVPDGNGGLQSIAKAYIRMSVRNGVEGNLLVVEPPPDIQGYTGDTSQLLFGVSGYGSDIFPIDIELGDGGETQSSPNVIITIDAIHMENIGYGKPIYDIELVYAQDSINHPKKVVYRIVQGRFIITPNVTR